MKEIWQSDDGKCTGTKEEVRDYEYQLKNPLAASIKKVESCYSVSKLLEQMPKNTQGIWEIRGEDPNCDFGGVHHEPYIATVQGTLAKAIEYAAKSATFWTWGGGGSIKEVKIVQL